MYSNSIESIPSVPCFLFSFYNFCSFYNLYRHPVATDASNCVFTIVTIGLVDDCVMIHFVGGDSLSAYYRMQCNANRFVLLSYETRSMIYPWSYLLEFTRSCLLIGISSL